MAIEIVFSLNKSIIAGLLATINSIARNTQRPEDLRFNVITPREERDFFQEKLDRAFPQLQFSLRVQGYAPPEYIQGFY